MRRIVLVGGLCSLACAPHEREADDAFENPEPAVMPDAPWEGHDTKRSVSPPSEPAEACEAAISDDVTTLFSERVLVRMPAHVQMREENPVMGMASRSGGFVVTCDAVLRRSVLMVFATDPKSTIAEFAGEITQMLERNGYVGARDIAWDDIDDKRRRAAVLIPELHGQPQVMLLVDIRRVHDVTTLLIFEAEPGDFERLEATLHASADSLVVAPPT